MAAVGPTQGDSVMWKTFLMSCIMMLSVSGVALAHFGMVIPSAGTVTDKKDADVTLDLSAAFSFAPLPALFGPVRS